ncbi:MAG: TIR domain-containing protein [Pyrinomonadaceae bacterium]
MPDDFQYDVFLSHSPKDKPTVRSLAQRLRADGLRVWLDDWELKPGDDTTAKIEEGLEHSRVLLLCMSANAFGSDWAQLESQTLRFRDPLNQQRRFIPLRLDATEPKDSLAQLLSINWLPAYREQAYAKLLEACRPLENPQEAEPQDVQAPVVERALKIKNMWGFYTCAFSGDKRYILTGGQDHVMRLWEVATGRCLRTFKGHTERIDSVAWSPNQELALSGSSDETLKLWDVKKGRCLRTLKGHFGHVMSVAWGADSRRALSGAFDGTMRLWDTETGSCLRVFQGHTSRVYVVAWRADQRHAFSGSSDNTARLWDVETGDCLQVFEGHTEWVLSLAWSPDQRYLLTGAVDNTMRLWEVATGRCLHVFEGHEHNVQSIIWSVNQRHILSGSADNTVRLWDVETKRCLRVFKGHTHIRSVIWGADHRHAVSVDADGGITAWDISEFVGEANVPKDTVPNLLDVPEQVEYTNAKVLLVGESGVGKTGLSKRLALNDWEPSDSTVGAWATHWKLEVDAADGVEREIWLWDFGGQADQRLIHQLYMDETALAVLVFDGQKEDLFETLGQWDRDLTRASSKEFAKLLVAGRVDAGGLRVSRSNVEAFAKERGYSQFLETSAKANISCEELKDAILKGIRWENIPWRTSPLVFKRLKEEIVRLKDEGRVLMRFNELRETLQLRLSGESMRFTDEELKAVVGLLAGPGVVWELKFGSWVLLQPERINAYAQAVIQTIREDKYERGCLPEERVLNGELTYQSSIARLEADEERFVLLAMHQTLVKRGLCLREDADEGPLLIFPSYYRRERPELTGHPAVLVSYRFNGFLDDIYATLVVRLHHTKSFEADELWRYAADFKSLSQGRRLGVKLERRGEGAGELEVYFDPEMPVAEKMIFSRYVHEHLLKKGNEVVRLRHYVCPHCGTPVRDRETAMKRLAEKGKQSNILCVNCEKRVPLWDDLEERFAAPEVHQRVLELDEQSQIVLDNADKERTLVGEVISTVSLAGQISRELTVSDNGIDMEIEFKTDAGEATGRKLYLQLKSGDSYLRKRKRDGAEIFDISNERHARYWMEQAFPVLLVVRNSEGEVRWMEVRDWLKQASENGRGAVRQIVFKGERFDVMSVRRWRDAVLSQAEL